MSDPVYKVLTDRNIEFTPSGKDYLIKCLNPEHEDANPSCRVDRVSGVAHCFSCGWKANLFKYFGIITNIATIRVQKLKEKLKAITEEETSLPMPPGATPYTQSIRGISVQTLRKFGAFYTNDKPDLDGRIIFPILDISGRVVVFLARHTLSDSKPKYLVFPKNKKIPLYPSIFAKGTNSVVLVEGIFDMLNLYDSGISNVACAFGTHTLINSAHEKLIPFKVQGITKIYILFDGDKAGRDAAKQLKPVLETENFIVEIIDLPDDVDPGSLGRDDILTIKKYIE